MRLTAFRDGDVHRMAVVTGADRVEPLATVDEFYDTLPESLAAARSVDRGRHDLHALRQVAAVPSSARILCVGLNYAAHVAEGSHDIPDHPTIFGRWTASLTVDGCAVPVPRCEPGLDWEVELAAIVGQPLYDVGPEQATDGVLGYAVFNDLSARTTQRHTTQWTLGKNADRSGPIGPIVTADEVGDPAAGLRMRTTVNGTVVQDGTTSDMIFSVGEILAYASRTMTLNPGDVVATGTVEGVGHARRPQWFLTPGDRVQVEIERLGVLENPIVEAP